MGNAFRTMGTARATPTHFHTVTKIQCFVGPILLEPADSFDVTIERIDGGYSSAAERLTVAQDVVGSIPTSRPTDYKGLI